jgi:YHS domain-containing protein
MDLNVTVNNIDWDSPSIFPEEYCDDNASEWEEALKDWKSYQISLEAGRKYDIRLSKSEYTECHSCNKEVEKKNSMIGTLDFHGAQYNMYFCSDECLMFFIDHMVKSGVFKLEQGDSQ